MAILFIQVPQVTAVNGNDFAWPNNPNGTPMQIPCTDTEIIASYWRIPSVNGNRVTGYNYIVASEQSVPPTPDALKILRIKATNTAGITTFDFAIADNDNVSTTSPQNQYAYLCDGLGGTLPVMPVVTIPVPMMQSAPQTNTNGLNTFIFSFPPNPNGLQYVLNGAWFNNAVPYAAYAPSGITTVAEFVTWANSNWSEYGTWTALSAETLKLASNVASPASTIPVFKAGISMDLTPVNFCFDLSAFGTPVLVNQFKFGSGALHNFETPFMLNNNPVTLANQLSRVMSSGTILDATTHASTHKLNILTTQATPAVYINGALVVTSTAGACS